MKKCDLCQGLRELSVADHIEPTNVGFSTQPLEQRIVMKREKCPKCDGKGMIKE